MDFPDYGLSIWKILDTLSKVEERDSLDILRDLSWADFDLVRVGNTESRGNDWVSVDHGLGVIQESHTLLRVSAYSVISPQPAFFDRRTTLVDRYLRSVQLHPTGQDGFMVNLLSPVGSFPERVTEMLTTGLDATREATIQPNRSEDAHDLEHWVDMGVSANLCGAVAKLVSYENGSGLSISIQRALTRQGRGESPSFRFTKSDAKALKETADVLRGWRKRDVERITGYVTRLVREEPDSQGSAIIRTEFGRRQRNIKVNFSLVDYDRVVQAHRERRMVSAVGDLGRSGNSWVLDNARNLRISSESAHAQLHNYRAGSLHLPLHRDDG